MTGYVNRGCENSKRPNVPTCKSILIFMHSQAKMVSKHPSNERAK
jgi:hypothetical protein